MTTLSSPLAHIKQHYTVVVVGSGYGGGIAASRLARSGQQVCVLERGKELWPGQYPNTLPEAMREMQADFPGKHLGSRTGLYDLRINNNMNVVVGCGLGGTSLINASVSLQAEPRVFEDPCWPEPIRTEAASDGQSLLQEGFRRAELMLRPVTYPDTEPRLEKTEAHRQSAAAMGEYFYRTPINVTFKDGVNHAGVEQKACVSCGDCVSGCNYSAKNTTLMNYLPDAFNHGAEIYTEVSVSRVAKSNNGWLIYYQPSGVGREVFNGPELYVRADIVILAAGTLGTTEILLRSHAAGLKLSQRLGEGFTGNGDVLAFAYNNDRPINGVGFGDAKPGEYEPVGPCITSVIDARNKPSLESGMVLEEGSLPGALAPILHKALSLGAATFGQDTDSGLWDGITEKSRELDSQLRGPYFGSTANTQTYLVMSHDEADGRMYLANDRLRVHWPDVGKQNIFAKVEDQLKKAIRPLGGTYLPNPIWTELFEHRLVTVHPLGGCTMASEAENGVVDHKCRLFAQSSGKSVHPGLYACDGSIIPRSLGVNPLLTICALTERACELMAQDHGWGSIDVDSPSQPPPEKRQEPKLGIQFTETMRGHFSPGDSGDYTSAAEEGKKNGDIFEFTLTILSDNLEEMVADENHKAAMIGTVNAPLLSKQPLMISNGRFNLFTRDPENVDTRLMRYRMQLTDTSGVSWYFSGFKRIRNDKGLDLWPDTTTLYYTVYKGSDENAPVHGRGILHILADDFARQLKTFKARNASNPAEALEAVARFGRYFAGATFESFGAIFTPDRLFDPDALPRQHRDLRVGPMESHSFTTEDGVDLRLSHYQGGQKGPVLLAHGLGVSSRIFSTDTIDTNLLEDLYAHGYDVWLLDFRASIELPAARGQFTADAIARFDWPAAVEKIRSLTAAEDIQVIAHCFGATTFIMAMLAGLQHIRSAVISQVATHMKAPPLSQLKAGLYLPELLETIGVDSLDAYVDQHANWLERLYDKTLRLYPIEFEERSNSAVARRITFMYGQLWETDQLNTLTHDNLHELFGIANIQSFGHLTRMIRTGHLVDAQGNEIYMPHLDRLSIPIRIIHGTENATFLPESTEITYDLLRRTNDPNLYSRILIPRYGHIDCIFGKNAAQDVYPYIVEHLESTMQG